MDIIDEINKELENMKKNTEEWDKWENEFNKLIEKAKEDDFIIKSIYK